ncbi:hypothetical protein INR49_032814 [Caranx melampygus]|nr:hypothetical protein INR49_032814 [Caranx melampygus]
MANCYSVEQKEQNTFPNENLNVDINVTSVHPPARAVLLSTVSIILVIVLVAGAELHAVVRCVELVAGVISKVKAIKSISGVTTKVVTIVNQLYPQHSGDSRSGSQQMHLFVTKPELSGVICTFQFSNCLQKKSDKFSLFQLILFLPALQNQRGLEESVCTCVD